MAHKNNLYRPYLSLLRLAVVFCLVCGYFNPTAAEPLQAQPTLGYATNSILSSGKWMKISIYDSGIQQLTYVQLQEWGFAHPERVKVYGYGGGGLSENLTHPYCDDLPLVPILRQSDRILFYGEGTVTWEYMDQLFLRKRNPYSFLGYYFLTENDEPDLALQPEPTTEITTQTVVEQFTDYALHEKELTSIGEIGRDMYGEDFRYTTRQDFTFDIPGIVAETANINLRFVAKSTQKAPLHITINNQSISGSTPYIYASTEYYEGYNELIWNKPWSATDQERVVVNLTLGSGIYSVANLDYIQLQMQRKLQLYDGVVRFRSPLAIDEAVAYSLTTSGATGVNIWDITNPTQPTTVAPTATTGGVAFAPATQGLREYIAFDPNCTFATPTLVGAVKNQDLHAIEQCDMVIVTTPTLLSTAQRLATFRTEHDNIITKVVDHEAIYNEFSSGATDATAIRRFMKMLYDRSKEVGTPPKYLLLLGDGIYNNRYLQVHTERLNDVYLPIFTQKEGRDKRDSYLTDDYYAFLTDEVGNRDGLDLERATMQVSVGRIPAQSKEAAEIAVDKVIAYSSSEDYGIWRNNVCFLADDGSETDGYSTSYAVQAEELSNALEKSFVPQKVLLDSYPIEKSGNGNSFPLAKEQLFKNLNDGVLVFNYIGHGSETSLTEDNMMTFNDIKNGLYNKRLPLWITATCDFGQYDNGEDTGAESILFNSKGGGIALYSTTRPVFTDKNRKLNIELFNILFEKDEEGKHYTLGEIMRLAKEKYLESFLTNPGANHLNFVLLGDPSMRLNYPKEVCKITHINYKEVLSEETQLKARELVEMKGEILLPTGERNTAFNGIIETRVYDSSVTLTTRDNHNTGSVATYTDRSSLLYMGRDSVRNGEYAFSFRMPSETNFSNELGLTNQYAYDSLGATANGFDQSFTVGGITDMEDMEEIKITHLYLNNDTFEDGGETNTTPLFVAEVEAPAGVNISGAAIGHDATLTIDKNLVYTLNNFFIFDIGSYTKGRVLFTLPELTEGDHTLKFKIWDTFNNSDTRTLTFTANGKYKPSISGIEAVQLPNSNSTLFQLRHDIPNAIISLSIEVYTLTGKLIWSSSDSGVSDMYNSFPLVWESGDMPKGVYLYRATITTATGTTTSEAQKLLITHE